MDQRSLDHPSWTTRAWMTQAWIAQAWMIQVGPQELGPSKLDHKSLDDPSWTTRALIIKVGPQELVSSKLGPELPSASFARWLQTAPPAAAPGTPIAQLQNHPHLQCTLSPFIRIYKTRCLEAWLSKPLLLTYFCWLCAFSTRPVNE